MKPRQKSFRTKPKREHAITVKQHDGGYLTQCSCGETIGHYPDRRWGRRAGDAHLRKVAPHLAGPRI